MGKTSLATELHVYLPCSYWSAQFPEAFVAGVPGQPCLLVLLSPLPICGQPCWFASWDWNVVNDGLHFWDEDKKLRVLLRCSVAGVANCPSSGHVGSVRRCHMARNCGLPVAITVDMLDTVEPGGIAAPASLQPHERHRGEDADKPPRALPHRNCERMNVSCFQQWSWGGWFCYTAIGNKYSHSFALLLPWLKLWLWYSWLLNNSGVRGADPLSNQKPVYNFVVDPPNLQFCIPEPRQLWIV